MGACKTRDKLSSLLSIVRRNGWLQGLSLSAVIKYKDLLEENRENMLTSTAINKILTKIEDLDFAVL